MNVSYERANAATSFEVSVPMELRLHSGRTLKIRGLSPNGLRLDDAIAVLPKSGSLRIPFQGYDVTVPVTFRKGKSTDFLTFDRLESRAQQMITLFHHGILTGEMVTAENVISRLDTPVDLIPMDEVEEETKVPPPRWRTWLPGVLYTLLAIAVFSTLAERIWMLVDTVPLNAARVVAPIDHLLAGDKGFVADILVAPGDEVTRGQRLVAVSNPESATAIERTRSDIVLAERRVARLQKEMSEFLARGQKAELVLENDLKASIEARDLVQFLSDYDLDTVRRKLARLQAFQAAPWPLDQKQIRLHRDLTSRLEQETAELRQLRRSLGREKAAASSLDIVATQAGRINALYVHSGQLLNRGMVVADLEHNAVRQVEGIVSAGRAAQLYVGMPARISLRTEAGARGSDATVTGFAAPDPGRFGPSEGVAVLLTPTALDVEQSRELLRPGAPVDATASLGRLAWPSLW